MGRHVAGRAVGDDPRIVTTPRAEGHDEPRGRLFDELDTEQAMAMLECLTANRTPRKRVLELA
jgi:hypothetical protein